MFTPCMHLNAFFSWLNNFQTPSKEKMMKDSREHHFITSFVPTHRIVKKTTAMMSPRVYLKEKEEIFLDARGSIVLKHTK